MSSECKQGLDFCSISVTKKQVSRVSLFVLENKNWYLAFCLVFWVSVGDLAEKSKAYCRATSNLQTGTQSGREVLPSARPLNVSHPVVSALSWGAGACVVVGSNYAGGYCRKSD